VIWIGWFCGASTSNSFPAWLLRSYLCQPTPQGAEQGNQLQPPRTTGGEPTPCRTSVVGTGSVAPKPKLPTPSAVECRRERELKLSQPGLRSIRWPVLPSGAALRDQLRIAGTNEMRSSPPPRWRCYTNVSLVVAPPCSAPGDTLALALHGPQKTGRLRQRGGSLAVVPRTRSSGR
jgi:hypothetical protein